ncbi:amidase [Amorphus sp. 3PC139-8]|uniref:amidase n=1 Tax=Amorphus sp. 3PC139-8 TaxID=2735676 RepID=UPI00345CE9D8
MQDIASTISSNDSTALLDQPIADLVDAVADERTSCSALAEAVLARIAAQDGQIKAWTHLDPPQVRASAERLQRTHPPGPLAGVPIGIKDSIDTCDMLTTYGSPIYSGYRPRADAACVALLRAAGAQIVGKTALTEFAAPYPGPTCNPHDLERTPGGSSSGSAAAVAADMVPVALGSQTMGSLIRPAAYCGIVGFKPSWGRISPAGMKSQVADFDHIGVMARRVDDAARVAALIATVDASAWQGRLSAPPRLALFRGPAPEMAEPPAVVALDRVAQRFAEAGAAIGDVPDDALLQAACDAQIKLLCYEMARSMVWEWQTHREQISPLLQSYIETGWSITPDTYKSASGQVAAARARVADLFGQADAILTYSAPGEAPHGLQNTGDTIFNRLWSVLRLPAITLPAGTGPNRLPLGVQIVGRYWDDARLLAVARWAEAVLSQQ